MNTMDRHNYTFRLQVEEDDQVTLSTAIRAGLTAGEIAKAKETIHRLLDEYTPEAAVPEMEAVRTPEGEAADTPEPDVQTADHIRQTTESPTESKDPAPASASEPEGARGLLRLRCQACGKTFGTFLKERQKEILCNCGHHINLTAPLARYRFTCPYCEKDTWGLTNLGDPEITIRCKCGMDVDVIWAPKAKEYQN